MDPDDDGFVDELTRADVTAASVFQAQLAVPGRVIPDDPEIEVAVLVGQQVFTQAGCAGCREPALPLDDEGWIYTEPNPYNPPGNLQVGEAPTLSIDLTSNKLDRPRLKPKHGVVMVPAFTDLKLHDITSGPDDPNNEPLDMHHPQGSPEFFEGNSRFLTRKLRGRVWRGSPRCVCSESARFETRGITTLALGWFAEAFPSLARLELSLLGLAFALLDAFRCFLVEERGFRGRAPVPGDIAHHHLPLHRSAPDLEQGTRADMAGWLHSLTGHLHLAA